LDETVGVIDGGIGLGDGLNGPGFEHGDQRCRPANSALESAGSVVVFVVLLPSSAGAAYLRTIHRASDFEELCGHKCGSTGMRRGRLVDQSDQSINHDRSTYN